MSLSALDTMTVYQENAGNIYENLGNSIFKVLRFCAVLTSNSEHWSVSVHCSGWFAHRRINRWRYTLRIQRKWRLSKLSYSDNCSIKKNFSCLFKADVAIARNSNLVCNSTTCTRTHFLSRSQWPRGLMRGSAVARLLGLWVRIPPGGMDVSVVSVVCFVQVEVSVTSWSLVQRSSTDCGASLCVI